MAGAEDRRAVRKRKRPRPRPSTRSKPIERHMLPPSNSEKKATPTFFQESVRAQLRESDIGKPAFLSCTRFLSERRVTYDSVEGPSLDLR